MSAPLPDVPESRPPSLRVGDAERQAVVDRLKAALDEGRLDLTEFDERSALAYAAKTEAELVPLTADLPAQPGHTPRPPVPGAEAPVRGKRRLGDSEATWLRIGIILTGIWAITSVTRGEFVFFWPIFPLGIWGLFILANRLTGRRH
ncbi:DUF1707 SHOCT-like domain-containing protein [Cryptosporangium arvum]|uniref:DUF1707 SHOCT-like domain-containing protein n=1 Tax=Cryptosporangium arvum TaxID=80871 RepID=UPI0004AED58E|nr:DUF1707 domain-containing protein [Cryptosporangium arvum]